MTTWSSVATSSVESRRSRTRDDDGLSVDELIGFARAEGVRIGCVVDEAHHGFHRAAQARFFFKIGRHRGEEAFHHLRCEDKRLVKDGEFSVERLKYTS